MSTSLTPPPMTTSLNPPPRVRSLLAERDAAPQCITIEMANWSDASTVTLAGVAHALEQLEECERADSPGLPALVRFRRSMLTLLSDLESRVGDSAA